MDFYDAFVKEAAENYIKLSDETSELYKRHHIKILKVPNIEFNGRNDSELLGGFMKENLNKIGMRFDAIIGSASHVVNNAEIKITDLKESENIKQMMHKNNDDKYVAFLNAHSKRCITINIPDGKEKELKMLFLNSERPLLCHIFVNMGNNSNVKLVEVFASSSAGSMVATMHEIKQGNYSNLEFDAVHNENSNTILLSFCKNKMGDDSKLKFNTFYNGAEHTRVRNTINASGQRSDINVNEAILGSSSQKFDIANQILNTGKASNATLDSKAVVMDSSFCVMKGYAKILKGASASRSYVHQRGIILDRGARIDGLPDMSVDETDVKATHSSATSPIDPDSVFYLMSKGIDELGVRKLIVSGFFGESISKMHNDKMREFSIALVNHKLNTKSFGDIPKPDPKSAWMFGEEREKDMFLGHYKYR